MISGKELIFKVFNNETVERVPWVVPILLLVLCEMYEIELNG